MLPEKNLINTQKKHSIKGVVPNTQTTTHGSIILSFMIENTQIQHTFSVVQDDIVIGTDGVLGNDFLRKYNCIIDYNTRELKIKSPEHNLNKKINECFKNKLQNESISLENPMGAKLNSVPQFLKLKEILVKNRSHNIINVLIKTTEDVVIEKQEIKEGIYVANSIASPENNVIKIAILNANENDVLLDLNEVNLKVYKLHDFNVIDVNKSQLNTAERKEQIRDLINLSHCNEEEEQTILKICFEYHDVFQLKGDRLSVTPAAIHKIPLLPGTNPINSKPFRLPFYQKENLEEEVQKLLKDNIIQPSKSPWCSPILLVPKKPDASGKRAWRLCIDFRNINEKTIMDAYPLPLISELLDSLGRATVYSSLDLDRAYWQIRMDPEDQEKTAFKANGRLYEWLRMPMGVKGAAPTFQRMMNNVLTGLQGEICLVYIDDIIVYGSSLNDHNEKLRTVLKRLIDYKLKIKPEKCQFLRKEISFLGHVVSKAGLKPDPKKIEAVLKYPIPRTQKEIKSLLGLFSYYRRYVPLFSQIIRPINRLLQKDVPYEWTRECNEAFESIKRKLTSSPVLIFPDFDKQFIIRTDASQFAVGAILSQGKIREDLPICYMSKSLNKHEIKYATVEKELLAIIYAVRYFRPYIYLRKALIITDHQALVWIMKLKNPASRLMRWKLELSEYDFEIIHRPGILNANADALSRIQIKPEELLGEEPDMNKIDKKYEAKINVTTRKQAKGKQDLLENRKRILENPISNIILEEIDILYFKESEKTLKIYVITEDSNFNYPNRLIKEIENKMKEFNSITKYATCVVIKMRDTRSEAQSIKMKELWSTIKSFCLRHKHFELAIHIDTFKNEFYFENEITLFEVFNNNDPKFQIKIVSNKIIQIDEEQDKKEIIENFHNNILGGHLGIQSTINKIKKQYYWEKMGEEIQKFINNCLICKKNKIVTHTKMPMKITTTASRPFGRVQMDCVGPIGISNSNNRFMLTFQCELTKYAECIPTPNITAFTVAQAFVEKIICRHGIPEILVTDQGTNFLSDMFQDVCKILRIEHITATAVHPQTMGQIERYHRTLGQYLKIFTQENRDSWDEWIPFALFTYNTSVHSSTKYSPHYLVYGVEANIPTNLKQNPNPIYNYENYSLILKNRLRTAHEIAKKNILVRKRDNKHLFDQTNKNPINFQIGDYILIINENKEHKFDENYKGPFKIIDIPSEENCLVQLPKRRKLFHKNKLKHAYPGIH